MRECSPAGLTIEQVTELGRPTPDVLAIRATRPMQGDAANSGTIWGPHATVPHADAHSNRPS